MTRDFVLVLRHWVWRFGDSLCVRRRRWRYLSYGSRHRATHSLWLARYGYSSHSLVLSLIPGSHLWRSRATSASLRVWSGGVRPCP